MNQYGQTPLLQAVLQGQTAQVKALLAQGADPNLADLRRGNQAALLITAQSGNLELSQALIAHGANVNVQDWQGLTPLHYAAIDYDYALAQQLLEAGASFQIKARGGESVIDYAEVDPELKQLLDRYDY